MQKTKRAVSLLLSFLLVLSCFTCLATVTAFAADGDEQADTYVVAGSPADIFGTAWDSASADNAMTKNADGKFEKKYTVTKAFEDVQLKVVKNGAEWIGDSTGSNITFDLTGAGDFTVTIDPETNEIAVTGDIVEFKTEFVYDTVFAVGNGEGFWLNGSSWTPDYAANEMTEVEDDVWEISFENVPDGFERQIKFAIDGAWTHNFGGAFEESGVETDAAYGGDNISFDTEEDSQTVTARLDLTGFDFATKTGAKFTITITPDEEETTAPAEEDATYVVAGSEGEIFGTAWDATNEDNLMTADGGKFSKTYTVTKAYEDVQLKVVKNGAEWIGDATGGNVTFDLTGAGDFTVTIDPETNEITVTGDIVFFKTTFEYDTVFAAGNGEGFWLNGASWDPAFAANEMTEVAEGVWEIEFASVPDGFERQIKFTIDGAWTHNFGGAFEESGVESDAVYNGDNITFDTEDDSQTVKAQLDLREFDFATKTGAKFTITIIPDGEGDVLYGDVDGDGAVKINDATAIQRHLAEREGCILEEGSDAFLAADVDGDGEITIDDVTLVQQYLCEFINKFPVEELV